VGRLGEALRDLAATLEKRFLEIGALRKVTEKINAGLLLDEILNHVFESFRPIIPYDRIGFSLLEEDGRVLRARWARSDAADIRIGRGYWAKMEGSSLQRIIETGQPRILNDLEEYLRQNPHSASTRDIVAEGMRSSLTCPLIALGKPIGFMFFSSAQPHAYENAHVELFLQIAGQLSVIVEKGRLYQELLELNELKNKFLGMAAHDLRNPIAVIKGYLRLLGKGMFGPVADPQREVLDTLDRVSRNMLDLINDLLDISAIEAGRLDLRMEEADLGDFLRECQGLNRLLAQEKSIALELELAAELPPARIDSNRMNQALNNLIANAIKFSHPNTTITLKATRAADEVQIAVQDQGQGIPAEELPKMFTDFGRTSVRPTAGEKSTGLGLAIVKRIVEAHGGRVWVESQVAVGSTFWISLPLHT